MKPVLALVPYGQFAVKCFGKFDNRFPVGKMILTGIYNLGGRAPVRDAVVYDILPVRIGKCLTERSRDGLFLAQPFQGNVRPRHHRSDKRFHIDDRRDKQCAFQIFLFKAQHTEPGADAVGKQGDIAPAVFGILHDGRKLRYDRPWIKQILFALSFAVLWQINA